MPACMARNPDFQIDQGLVLSVDLDVPMPIDSVLQMCFFPFNMWCPYMPITFFL